VLIKCADQPHRQIFEKLLNAGGVISSYAEYIGENPEGMFDMIEENSAERRRIKNCSKKSSGSHGKERGCT